MPLFQLLLQFKLHLFLFMDLVGWECHLGLVQLLEHYRRLHIVHLGHLEVGLLDRRFVHPALTWVLYVGSLVELVSLFVNRWHVVGHVTAFFPHAWHLVEWTAFDRHLRLELAPLRAVHLRGLLEDKLL